MKKLWTVIGLLCIPVLVYPKSQVQDSTSVSSDQLVENFLANKYEEELKLDVKQKADFIKVLEKRSKDIEKLLKESTKEKDELKTDILSINKKYRLEFIEILTEEQSIKYLKEKSEKAKIKDKILSPGWERTAVFEDLILDF